MKPVHITFTFKIKEAANILRYVKIWLLTSIEVFFSTKHHMMNIFDNIRLKDVKMKSEKMDSS